MGLKMKRQEDITLYFFESQIYEYHFYKINTVVQSKRIKGQGNDLISFFRGYNFMTDYFLIIIYVIITTRRW